MSRKTKPDIDSLLSDRARYEAWLAQLAAKASQIPSHVVDRVRADYQDRLTHVIDDLRARADELRAEKASLEQRIGTLASELTVKRDGRAEDELRAMVGEYEDTAWTKKAAEHDAAIQSLDAERVAREAELARIKDLLAEATRPSRAVRAVTEAEIPEEPTPVRPSQPSAAAAAHGNSSASQTPAGSPSVRGPSTTPTGKRPSPFDELGFLRTVVGRATPLGIPAQAVEGAVPAAAPPPPASVVSPAPVAATPPPPAPAPSAPPPPLSPPPTLPEPRPLAHAAGAPAASRASAPAVAPPAVHAGAAAPSPIAPPPPPLPPPVPAAARRGIPSFEPPPIPDAPVAAPARASAAMPAPAESVGDMVTFGEPEDGERAERDAQAARTLKCQECGWMNNPTEWYCEKCGGELAAF